MIGSIEKKKNGYLMRVTVGYNENGNPDRISKMTQSKLEKDAKMDLIKWIAELEKEGYDKPKVMKFGKFIKEHWRPYVEKELAYKTWHSYDIILTKRFIPTFKNKEISKIKKMDLVKIMDNLKRLDDRSGPLAKSTKINILAAIQSVFDYALYLKIITDDPSQNIRIGRDEREHVKTYKPYNTKEIAEIFTLLDSQSLMLRAAIATALVTGAREGEIAGLETKHLNKKDSTITFEQTAIEKKGEGAVIQHYTKNKVNKVVHVPESLIDLLLELVYENEPINNVISLNTPSELVFKGKKDPYKPIWPSSLLKMWKRFVKKEHIRYVRFHDLRHTSATWLLSQTKNLKAVQGRLGHKDYLTTANFYAHVLEETDKESGDQFKQFMPSATKSATKR